MKKLTVYPEVEAGTDRGGEDLFIVFEILGDSPNLDDVTDNDVSIEDSGDCSVDVDNAGVYTFTTPHYDFEWSGTAQDLLELAKEKKPTDWQYAGKVGSPLKVRLRKFIDGNAD